MLISNNPACVVFTIRSTDLLKEKFIELSQILYGNCTTEIKVQYLHKNRAFLKACFQNLQGPLQCFVHNFS